MVLAAERGFSFADPVAVAILFGGLALFAATVALTKEPERSFTSAIVYLVLGAAGALLLDVLGYGLLDPFEDAEVIEHLAEFAVIVALFSAGLRLDRPLAWRSWRSAAVLLGLVMPLTIAAVTLFAHNVMGLTLGAAVLLGAVLAPTDPVLAGDLQVGPPGEQDEPEPKFALTAEAGLNDGLAFPFVFLGLFIAVEGGTDWVAEWVLGDVLYAIAALLLPLRDRRLVLPELDGWIPIAVVLVVYGASELASAYGFLAAFAAGIAFRRYERDHEAHQGVHHGAEVVEKFGELAVILLLGSMVTLSGLAEPGWDGWLLCAVLLLAIRPLAVLVAFLGSRLDRGERAFLGWFGVRGIGSLYYVSAALSYGVLQTDDENRVFWTVAVVILVSITVHGITGTPLSRRLRRARISPRRAARRPR